MIAPTVLLLAGTAEAREIAEGLRRQSDWRVVASLAGVTRDPAPLPCETRVGGFGGVAGLADWLRRERCAAVVDATHPFAAEITRNALAAAQETGTPILRFERAAWLRPPHADWREVDSALEAAAAPPSGARVLLATGSKVIAPYAARDDVWWALRVLDAASVPPAPFRRGLVIAARPPFSFEDEMTLMREHRISHVIAKHAGGAAARPKIDAAAQLGVETVLIKRPTPPDGGATATTLAGVMQWLKEILA